MGHHLAGYVQRALVIKNWFMGLWMWRVISQSKLIDRLLYAKRNNNKEREKKKKKVRKNEANKSNEMLLN